MIRKLLLPAFLFCAVSVLKAQVPVPKAIIRGSIVDSAKGSPLAYATLTLIDKKSNKPVKNTLSKEDGSFEFAGLPKKRYLLSVASVGYKNKTVTMASFPSGGDGLMDKVTVQLVAAPEGMGEVIVSSAAKKPIIKQEVDRVAYDVQADPENGGMSVLDMLRKVPLISVDASDNILLKGSAGYKILINGQPSALIAQNPSDIFKAMPASNILKIEVITTPPAKYDAEGLAGIINIITKKNIANGYNCNASANYNTAYSSGLNFNGTVKQSKLGMGGYFGWQIPNFQTSNNGYTNNIKSPDTSYVSQQGTNIFKNRSWYASIDLSYEIDSLNLISTNFTAYKWIYNRHVTQFSSTQNNAQALEQSDSLLTLPHGNYLGTDCSVNYQHGFKGKKERMLTASYKYTTQKGTNYNTGDYTERFNYTLPDYTQFNQAGGKEHTILVDYVHPLKTLTIEGGAKAILRHNYSNFNYNDYDSTTSQYVTDTTQTNDFNYKQNVFSVYNSYELKLEKFVAKAGLRLEHTAINANFASGGGSSFSESYNNLIPSISMQRKFNGNNSINIGFTERLQRPSIWQLNPYVNRSNPQVISFGNPNLQPVLNHSFETNYSSFAKGNITVGLSYSFANNTIQSVTSVNADTITQTTYQNVGKSDALGLTLNGSYPITRKMNVNINSQLQHIWLKGTFNGELYSQDGYQGRFFISASYNLPNNYHVSIDGGYDSRHIMLQGRDNEYLHYSFGGSKDFWNKKASISIYAMDVQERYRKVENYTNTATFNQYSYFYQYARRANITIRYKFGHLASNDVKKVEKTINNDDTK